MVSTPISTRQGLRNSRLNRFQSLHSERRRSPEQSSRPAKVARYSIPRFRDVFFSISNEVKSLQIADHGDKNFHACRGAFNLVDDQWEVTEYQQK